MSKKSDVVPVVIPLSAHLDGPTLIGTARGLGREGVPVHVIACGKYPIARTSRYIKSLKTFPSDQPDTVWQAELESLLQKIVGQFSEPVKPLLFFCTENDIYRFSSMREFLESRFELVPSFSEVLGFLEKDAQLPVASQAGFLVPVSMRLDSKSDLLRMVELLRFPVIVKPLARHTIGVFDHKALIIDSPETLETAIGRYLDKPPTALIAQEYVVGTDNDILIFMGSSDKEGNIRSFVTGRKLRQNPPHHGMMACGYIEELSGLETRAKELCKLYKINGFIGIECKCPTGTEDYFYIETSFRPEIFNEMSAGVGVNLVFDVYTSKLGKTCSTKRTAKNGSWYDLFTDWDSIQTQVRKGESSWSVFFKKLPRPITYSHFAFDDPLPFFARLLIRIKEKFTNLLSKYTIKKSTTKNLPKPDKS
ncbi:MAG: hypothetical protein LBQ66_08105 [Planctomycetaceae bacterium]|jgi:predicted ATP-grasp superfamily ATP-dependent carboligase|nr:hypothetical protein [Planctomycetaceae bacterium]